MSIHWTTTRISSRGQGLRRVRRRALKARNIIDNIIKIQLYE